MFKKKQKESDKLLPEVNKQENSKQKFLKSISEIKFDIAESDLAKNKKIKSGFYDPCDEFRTAIKNYSNDVKLSSAKSKKPEILKLRLNQKQLDALIKTLSSILVHVFQKNKDITVVKNDIIKLIKTINSFKKSILSIGSNNKKIRKQLDILIKDLTKIQKVIEKNEKDINEKAKQKRESKNKEIYLQEITIVGYKKSGNNNIIEGDKFMATAYNIYIKPQAFVGAPNEVYEKIKSLDGVEDGKNFYNKLIKDNAAYTFDISSEWKVNKNLLVSDTAKNKVVDSIKKMGYSVFLQEKTKITPL